MFSLEQLKLPPPPPPPNTQNIPYKTNSTLKLGLSPRKIQDNVESIDMDLSDDDVHQAVSENIKVLVDPTRDDKKTQGLMPPPPFPDLPDDVDANNLLDDLNNDLNAGEFNEESVEENYHHQQGNPEWTAIVPPPENNWMEGPPENNWMEGPPDNNSWMEAPPENNWMEGLPQYQQQQQQQQPPFQDYVNNFRGRGNVKRGGNWGHRGGRGRGFTPFRGGRGQRGNGWGNKQGWGRGGFRGNYRGGY